MITKSSGSRQDTRSGIDDLHRTGIDVIHVLLQLSADIG
jgi:hypothetical protein